MKIAIYARKSRLSDKGESINNQLAACKNYILHWSNAREEVEFMEYKDEGYSGGTTERPEFKKLLIDARNNKFNKLVCYRLDRISRNIADFSNTYELLNAHAIEFVSVKEQFDTSTPIGRAMLNIAMVFAQLERETIAERIKDNMMALAKTGRWLGGKTPTGYVSKQVDYIGEGHTKKMYKLEQVPHEIEIIKLIFSKFLEIKSLRGVESYLMLHSIYSPNGVRYTAATLKDILANPVYAYADQATYHYFYNCESGISSSQKDFNGEKGLMVYNRTEKVKYNTLHKPITEWVVAIGKHDPIIAGTDWVYIQHLLEKNNSKCFYNKESMNYGLLSSLVKCSHCGGTMKIKKGKLMADGTQAFVYVCSTKDLSRGRKCNIKNIIGQEADQDVLDYLVDLAKEASAFDKRISMHELAPMPLSNIRSNKLKELEKDLIENATKINNLMNQMTQLNLSSTLLSLYLEKLKVLDNKKQKLTKERETLEAFFYKGEQSLMTIQLVKKALNDFILLTQNSTMPTQRAIVRSIIERITWDGENLHIDFFGQKP